MPWGKSFFRFFLLLSFVLLTFDCVKGYAIKKSPRNHVIVSPQGFYVKLRSVLKYFLSACSRFLHFIKYYFFVNTASNFFLHNRSFSWKYSLFCEIGWIFLAYFHTDTWFFHYILHPVIQILNCCKFQACKFPGGEACKKKIWYNMHDVNCARMIWANVICLHLYSLE